MSFRMFGGMFWFQSDVKLKMQMAKKKDDKMNQLTNKSSLFPIKGERMLFCVRLLALF